MNRKLWIAATMLLTVLSVLLFAAGERGGYIHMESAAFLQVYNDPRPVPNILYDPLQTDWNYYQARELSYLVDCFDARFIYACARLGHAHFYSLSAMMILLLCVLVQQYFLARDFPKLPPWLCSLFSLAFAAAPACTKFCFFRSAKPLTALAATVISFASWRLYLRREAKSAGAATWTMLGGALFLAPLADRQGEFLSACFAGFCGVTLVAAAFPQVREYFHIGDNAMRKLRTAALLGGGAVLFGAVYDLHIAPALIRALNGYDPSFEFQNIGGGGIFNVADGGRFLLGNLGFMFVRFYGIPALLAGMLIAVAAAAFYIRRCRENPRQRAAALLTAACVAAMLVCADLMTFRHDQMLRDDVIHGTYFMPMLAVLVFLAALAAECAASAKAHRILAGALLLTLAMAAAEPLLPKPAYDHLEYFKKTSPLVRKAMNDKNFNADTALLPYSCLKLVEHFRATTKR